MSVLPSRCPLASQRRLSTIAGLALGALAGALLIWLPPFHAFVCIMLVAVVIGTLIEPLAGLAAGLFLGPFRAYLSALVPSIPAQIGHVFIVLALGSWLGRSLWRRDVRIVQFPLLFALLAFIGAVLVSLWHATGVATFGLLELVKWVQIVLICVFVSQHLLGEEPSKRPHLRFCAGERRLRWLLAVIIAVGLFQAGMGIWQSAIRGEGPDHFEVLDGAFHRAYGTFQQPNPYGGYLGLTAALALGVAADGIRSKLARDDVGPSGPNHRFGRRPDIPARKPTGLPLAIIAGSAGLAMVVALGASWSRGAWMGFATAALAIAVSLPRKTGWGLLLGMGLIIASVGLCASGVLPASLTARLGSFVREIRLEDVRGVLITDVNYAVIERLAHWQAAVSIFRHNMWAGVGFGCYDAAYTSFALINWPIALGHAHNYYLNLAAETGLIGLAAYGSLWVVVFVQTWRVTRRARGLTRGLAVGLLGAWTHITVHHLLDNLYVNNTHLLIGTLFGVLVFVVHQTRKMRPAHDA